MKNLTLLSALILCGCLANLSCTGSYKYDKSLTGTISYTYSAHIESSFDGIPLIGDNNNYYSPDLGECIIDKISKTKVSFTCIAEAETLFHIIIPELPVSGKPYDVTFDYVSTDATVRYNDTEYDSVSTSIKGWMKESSGLLDTRYSPRYPIYDCDITINCTIDGKELNLKITKLIGEAL